MRCHLLIGDDQGVGLRVAALLDGLGRAEVIDAAEEGGPQRVIEAVCAASMFGGQRIVVVEHAEAIDEVGLARIAGGAELSDAVVVARSESMPAARARQWTFADVERFSTPRGRDVDARIDALAASLGVRLEAGARRELAVRCARDLERAGSVLRALAAGGYETGRLEQVRALLGTCAPDEAPWSVTDALEAGDLGRAVRAAERLEPVAVAAYLSSRLVAAGRLVDARCADAASAAAVLGVGEYVARRTLVLAGRLGECGVSASWRVVGPLDAAVKSTTDAVSSGARIDVALGRLAPMWGPPGR